ncbi:RidA family protein [bacterium]|nr:RidA family protein [bacterium]
MDYGVIETGEAPSAVGPYSQGCVVGKTVYVSGQIPIDPATGELVEGDIREATRRCMDNVLAVVRGAGAGGRLVRVGIYLTDMSDFGDVNEIYATYFDGEPPARACVEVSGLPKGASMEIEAIAVLP